MNASLPSIKEYPELQSSKLKVEKDDSFEQKQTTIAGNKLILEMPETTFLEGEKVTGNVILDLRTRLNIKRINIQVIGELSYITRESISPSLSVHEKMLTINEALKNSSRTSTLAGVQRQKSSNFRQMNSYSRVNNRQNSESTPIFTIDRKLFNSSVNKVFPGADYQLAGIGRGNTLKPSQTLIQRGPGGSNTKINGVSRQSTQATTEIFCHYLVPIFQLKKRIQPGKYDFPFSFTFVQLHAPTVDLSRNNFGLKIKYTIIAEVEENPDDEEFAEEEEYEGDQGEKQAPQKKQNLKCMTNLEIFWNYKKHLDETDPYSEKAVCNRWRFSIPRPLCCCLKYDVHAEIHVPKTIFLEGELITFTLKLDGVPNPNDVDLRINLFEEVSNSLIELRDTDSISLIASFTKKIVDGKLVIAGDFDLGIRAAGHSIRSEDWNVSHALEFYIKTKTFLSKREEKYILPCFIISQMYQKKETKKLTKMPSRTNETQNSEERLTLVHSKFKLEDRFDITRHHKINEADPDDDQARSFANEAI